MLFRFEDQALHRNGNRSQAAPVAIVKKPTGFPYAPLGGPLDFAEQVTGGMARLQLGERFGGAVEDDGEFIVEIPSGSSSYGANAVGLAESFHA
jgi:hypothetical protein